jgi:hypothetical protein
MLNDGLPERVRMNTLTTGPVEVMWCPDDCVTKSRRTLPISCSRPSTYDHYTTRLRVQNSDNRFHLYCGFSEATSSNIACICCTARGIRNGASSDSDRWRSCNLCSVIA